MEKRFGIGEVGKIRLCVRCVQRRVCEGGDGAAARAGQRHGRLPGRAVGERGPQPPRTGARQAQARQRLLAGARH